MSDDQTDDEALALSSQEAALIPECRLEGLIERRCAVCASRWWGSAGQSCSRCGAASEDYGPIYYGRRIACAPGTPALDRDARLVAEWRNVEPPEELP